MSVPPWSDGTLLLDRPSDMSEPSTENQAMHGTPSRRAPASSDPPSVDDPKGIRIEVPTAEPVIVHWGLTRPGSSTWTRPDPALWPAGSQASGDAAVETLLQASGNTATTTIFVPEGSGFDALCYVLRFPSSSRWDNNHGKNYRIALPPRPKAPLPDSSELLDGNGGQELFSRRYALPQGDLLAVAERQGDEVVVHWRTNLDGPWILHWGIVPRRGAEWRAPEPAWLAPGSTLAGDRAARTALTRQGRLLGVDIRLPSTQASDQAALLCAVLHRPDTGQWLHDADRDFEVPLRSGNAAGTGPRTVARDLRERVIDRETTASSWTLMHRFELCTEMLDEANDDPAALAVLTVWLRYSALRQLDWQRRYNTQPRRLAHAQDRLTRRVAQLWRQFPTARLWGRLLLGNVGRGGEGQRVRDDILAIMHRHGLKEASGTFIEQWHQKLHNNTTPDDIAICDAYCAFLRSGGSLQRFNEVLKAHGVTRARLASYERAIVSEPVMPHADIGALVADMESYLGLLRSVHSSTDLASARVALGGRIAGEIDEILGRLIGREPLGQNGALAAARALGILQQVARVRELVACHLEAANEDPMVRDLLYLDLALGDTLRSIVEEIGGIDLEPSAIMDLVGAGLLALTPVLDDPEFRVCARHWQQVEREGPDRDATDAALRAASVVERLSRWVAAGSQKLVEILKPPAEELGRALQAEDWAVRTFAEEIVRGGPLFALGSLLGRADAALRGLAHLGPWQVVSPGSGFGRLVRAAKLLDAQGRVFDQDTVLICDEVGGDEEIPPRVTVVVTRRSVDLLSHLAVRAREAGVLLATLLDPQEFSALAEREGTELAFWTTSAGEVTYGSEAPNGSNVLGPRAQPGAGRRLVATHGSGRVVGPDGFRPDTVGSKSRVLAELRAELPDWVQIPASMAIGFGGLERALEHGENLDQRRLLAELERELDDDPRGTLKRIRELIVTLLSPPALIDELAEVSRQQGLPLMDSFEQSYLAIKRVWASQYNDRAHFARKARGLSDQDVSMAVLIQNVVDADYAFVIHTRNPLAPDRAELYGELVLGLGETLVGNYPGRALGFIMGGERARVVSYPSKSTVLRASGLIFRSDSNAEDLEGLSGAGLHDSVTSSAMHASVADYADEPLLSDEGLRERTFAKLFELGTIVEGARGAPQDIEGAISNGKIVVLQSRPQVGL